MTDEELIQQEVENLLREKIGLNPESIGAHAIFRAMKKGMRAGKMRGLSTYLKELKSSPALFEALVEAIVVPETSFFRSRAAFVFLRQWVAQEWLQKRPPKRQLRLLSLPCSTGEEPYSIAITLFEEKLVAHEFHIDGVDISAEAIAKAKTGIYSPYAFRRQTYRNDDRYFSLGIPEGVTQGKRTTQRYFLADKVRQAVTFSQGNILDPQLFQDQAPYDVIFCRNLLIYFDQVAREQTFRLINRLLRPEGLLFVGYAETNLVNAEHYRPVPYPQTFAYRKQIDVSALSAAPYQITQKSGPTIEGRSPKAITQTIVRSMADKPVVTLSSASTHQNHPPTHSPESASEHSSGHSSGHSSKRSSERSTQGNDASQGSQRLLRLPDPSLVLAQQLANQGKIEQAIKQCDQYIRQYPTAAKAYLLRGELYQANGDETAAKICFEKAIYLEPQLTEALTHLMLIQEAHGDTDGAATLKARLQRLTCPQ